MSNSELKGIAGEPLYEYCPSCGWLLDQDGHCANEECKHPNNTHNCNIHPADYGRICDLALSERHQRLVGLLSDIKGDLGSAEWGTPEHGEEILMGLIDKYYPKIKAALEGEGR